MALKPSVGISCLQQGFMALSLAVRGSLGDTAMLFIFHVTANPAHISVAIILCFINLTLGVTHSSRKRRGGNHSFHKTFQKKLVPGRQNEVTMGFFFFFFFKKCISKPISS